MSQPAPDPPPQTRRHTRVRTPRAATRQLATVAVRLAVGVVLAAVVAAPVAAAWAVTQTRVEATVGITPVTFALQPARHSEVRLGIPGTVYVPVSRGPFGVVATVDGPGEPETGDGDLASYVSPDMLELYTGLFHDPGPAVATYVDLLLGAVLHEFLLAELVLALVGGLAWSATTALRHRRPAHAPRSRSRSPWSLLPPCLSSSCARPASARRRRPGATR